MSVDQSLSHCAVVVWENGVPIYREMIKTGSTQSKGKKQKDVDYFDTVFEQIDFISSMIVSICEEQGNVQEFVMEALSLGSAGNATRDLAGLFYCIALRLVREKNLLKWENIHTVAPTSVKAFARQFLPEDERVVMKVKVDKKTGKKVESLGKVDMKKPQMIRAVDCDRPGWLDGLTLAAGKADYADAYLIGKKFMEGLSEGKG